MKTGMLKVIGIIISFYVLVNVGLIGFVPILHHVRLEITVVDPSDSPLKGVAISWVNNNPTTGFQWTEPAGVTDERGRLLCDMTIQEQPLWVFPRVGCFRFQDRTLGLTAKDYEEQLFDLSTYTPKRSYRNTDVSVKITMKRRQLP